MTNEKIRKLIALEDKFKELLIIEAKFYYFKSLGVENWEELSLDDETIKEIERINNSSYYDKEFDK